MVISRHLGETSYLPAATVLRPGAGLAQACSQLGDKWNKNAETPEWNSKADPGT